MVTNTGGNTWVYSDYLQTGGEVKERNRFFSALIEIREITVLNSDEQASSELTEQFKLIAQKCDDALKPISPTNK